MFGKSEKIFSVYEKPEASEPTDRVVLLRDGFCVWAFLFNLLWLLANRMWAVALGYIVISIGIIELGDALGWNEAITAIVQLGLQVILGFNAYDLQGWTLTRRSFRFAGVLAAETPLQAQRRYYEFAA